MLKHLKYALMAFFLIVGTKLLQSLFVDQDLKKHKVAIKKSAPLQAEKAAEKNVLGVKEAELEQLESDAPAKEVIVESVQKPVAQSEPSTNSKGAYPSLDDLKKNYLSIKTTSLQEGRSREDVVIRYYKHEKDGNKVYSLRKLRYYIHEKPAAETEGLGSNVMYYGDQVKQEDIQIVAYTLLENGIPLKSIERSKFDWKSNAIEIGTDSLLIGKTNLSKEQIRNFSF